MRALLLSIGSLAALAAPLRGQPRAPEAAVKPEALLPAASLAYFRYDGYEPHRQAYEKTALAKIMNDDLGDFLEHLLEVATKQFVKDTIPQDAEEKKEGPPKKDPRVKAAQAQLKKVAALFPEMLKVFWRHGIAVSLETPDLHRWQIHVVVPEGAAPQNRAVLLPLLQLLGEWDGQKVRTTQIAGRTISWQSWRSPTAANPLPIPMLADRTQDAARQDADRRFGWWQEGNHLVLTVGTEPFEALLDVVLGRRPSAAAANWHQDLARFNGYETDVRSHVDLEKVIDLMLRSTESASPYAPLLERPLRRLVAARLGLRGLKSLAFHLGFSGKYQRSTVIVGVDPPKERQGFLKLFSTPLTFDAKQLPPLPADADFVEVHRIDFERVYDELIDLARAVAAVTALQGGNLGGMELFDLDHLLGINTRKDLLASLDSTVVVSGAHTEGPFLFGACVAIQAKDEKKLRRSMENLTVVMGQHLTNILGIGGKGARFEERMYRGVRLDVLKGSVPLTYTIYKGWLVMALTPQPVTGFIARAGGRRTAWKLPPEAEEALALAKAHARKDTKLATVWVSDPRRTVEIYLSLVPALAAIGGGQLGLDDLDIAKIPNARAVTDHMFPHTTLLYDDGRAFRFESHYSIDVPGLGGWMLLLFGFAGVGWLF